MTNGSISVLRCNFFAPRIFSERRRSVTERSLELGRGPASLERDTMFSLADGDFFGQLRFHFERDFTVGF